MFGGAISIFKPWYIITLVPMYAFFITFYIWLDIEHKLNAQNDRNLFPDISSEQK